MNKFITPGDPPSGRYGFSRSGHDVERSAIPRET